MALVKAPPPLHPDGEEGFAMVDRPVRWRQRVVVALLAMALVVLVGGISVFIAGEGDYSFFEALYFSLITVSTVGYGELPQLAQHPWARVVSALTIVFGLVVLAYFQSTLTALFLEGAFSKAFRRRSMNSQIEKLSEHYIVVGCGRVGQYVAAELMRAGLPFVVIERNPAAVQHLEHETAGQILYLEGDANDDEILHLAGIQRAQGLVTSLSLDRDNLFVTLSARTMNPQLRIIAKVVNSQNEGKFLRAGASHTVSPQQIGGLRLATAVAMPHVTEFFDRILHMPGEIRIHELLVTGDSRFANKPLRDAGLRSYGNLLVVAVRNKAGDYSFNPGPEEIVEPGAHLIVLGPSKQITKLGLAL
jgi:voltage-gated potassium channel